MYGTNQHSKSVNMKDITLKEELLWDYLIS